MPFVQEGREVGFTELSGIKETSWPPHSIILSPGNQLRHPTTERMGSGGSGGWRTQNGGVETRGCGKGLRWGCETQLGRQQLPP
jgi:hypothetical protein